MIPGAGDDNVDKIARVKLPGTIDDYLTINLRGITRSSRDHPMLFNVVYQDNHALTDPRVELIATDLRL